MSQNDIENNKINPSSDILNTGAKKIDVGHDNSQVPSQKEKDSYKKVVDLIKIWERDLDTDANKNWEEFENELEENRIEIKKIK